MNNFPGLLATLPQGVARSEHTYSRNQAVFRQGDPCGGLWFVQSGRVDLQRVTESGHLVLIHRAISGDYFAEASLFSAHYHCTARTVQPCTLIEIGRQDLLDALSSQSQFAAEFCSLLAGQVQSYRRVIEILSIRKAEDRVFQAVALGMLGDDIKAFAARIGLSHEVVYRCLARLTEQGKMNKTGRGRFAISEVD